MSLSKFISLSLVVAVATASPVLKSPSRVLRRDPPAPSAYPLGDACDHEWQYLNFNPSDATDSAHLMTLHNVICSGEMRAVSSYGQASAQSNLKPYARYFPPSDEDDDTQGQVASVLGLIAGTSSTDGAIGAVVGGMVVDNLDFGTNVEGAPTCATGGDDGETAGYTVVDTLDDLEKIHFCDPAWALGSAGDVDCGSLDPYPSTKMDSFSRVALHEMTHYSTVGPASELGEQIVDVKNTDGNYAYDPPRVHGLIDPNQDNQPGLPEDNADSYAWMSLDSFVSDHCSPEGTSGNDYQFYFTQNPPNYTPGSPGKRALVNIVPRLI
ncbi:hypothetical protein MMC10_006735 [Thelotrema lepadinum]|nr:hypothetical protein [Thelotrema lepadinum]